MGSIEDEKRDSRRESLMLKVQYPDQDDFIHDCTENISRGGTFIFTEKDWQVGDRIKISLSFPGLLKPLQLMAEVTWKRTDRIKGIGVKFLFDEYPGTKEKLYELIDAIQKKEPAVLARKYRILVAEDNPFIQKLLKEGIEGYTSKKFLDQIMFIFLQATSGYEGLKILEEEKVDLVICDLYLPILDGFEMISRIREKYPYIPIIAVSSGDEESGRRAIKLGADIFLPKPLVLSKLFNTISALLKIEKHG
jgi:uncharacterized protein (TIGR02266 family)